MASRWIAGQGGGPVQLRRNADATIRTTSCRTRTGASCAGLSVFAAWLNHQDTRSINSMDTLVTENGIPYLKHYLLDFGSILGSAGVEPK